MYQIQPMTAAAAQEISTWCYPGEYALYSFHPDAETLAELLGGDYYACYGAQGELVGYFCYGACAHIPTVEPGCYPDGPLDVGLGMRPALCGQGLGADFLAAGLDYGISRFQPSALRLTVAQFNQRARTLYCRAGFALWKRATHQRSRMQFQILLRQL